ncbi:MAG TPA: FtsX-like permease family protein, partial [Conexibacter sp.]|nr:FtsX-like permease family protein [Conexibacter sp.]
FVTDATAQRLRADLAGARASGPGTVSAVMVGLRPGRSLADVDVPGIEAVEQEAAARAMPGYKGELMTTQLVQVCLYVIGAALLATFFWMVTVQKSASLAVLRAAGLSSRALALALAVQVLGLTLAGLAAGWLIAAGLTATIPDAISAVLRTGDVVSAAAILLVLSLLAAGLALRTLLRTDPLLALQRP